MKNTRKTKRPAAGSASKPKSPAARKTTPTTTPAGSGELEELKEELRRVNQQISKIARAGRPDAVRQTNLPEKQELLQRKADLERNIRAKPNA